ncbi:MAG: hypothetical protein A2096_12400 [Spirochaetes bacterium GWF1_41_5]|nr:MAG: hypothetical protein A2096_12400 [Spirochaetes bacterium GWF1_41_5]
MKAFFGTFIKEIKLLTRDPAGLILLFLMPSAFIISLSLALEGTFMTVEKSVNKYKIAVVNNNTGHDGKNIIDLFEKSGKLIVLTNFEKTLLSEERARRAIIDSDIIAAVIIPQLDKNRDRRAEIKLIIDPGLANEVGSFLQYSLQQYIYISEIARLNIEKNMLQKSIYPQTVEYKANLGTIASNSGDFSIKKYYALREATTDIIPTSVQQNVPGWTIFALFWIAQILGINILGEITDGSFRRVKVSPTSERIWLTGKIVPYFLINLLQVLFLFALGVYLMPKIGLPALEIHNTGALVILTLAVSLCAISLGVLFAALSRSSFMLSSFSAMILLLMSVLGGIMVPKFVMPPVMQDFSMWVPHGWAIDGYMNVLVKQSGIRDILPAVYRLLIFSLLFFSAGYLALKSKLGRI